jgi:hypothetical protein
MVKVSVGLMDVVQGLDNVIVLSKSKFSLNRDLRNKSLQTLIQIVLSEAAGLQGNGT